MRLITVTALPLLLGIILSSCKLEPGQTTITNALIPIEERLVPETGQAGTPVNIYLRATLENDCWSNIHFMMEQRDDRKFEVWALADFHSLGICNTALVTGDTTISFTPDRHGDHVITFWMSQQSWVIDTIRVAAAPEEE